MLPGGAGVIKALKGGDDVAKMQEQIASIRRRSAENPPISRKQEVLETELYQNRQRQKDLRSLMEDSTAAWTRPMREELSTLVNRQGQLDQELRILQKRIVAPPIRPIEHRELFERYEGNRAVPKLEDGSDPDVLYRMMSREE